MQKFWFVMGCLLAGLGVTAGAFAAHSLKQRLSQDLLSAFETGVRYQMYHAFGLIALALAMSRWTHSGFQWAGGFFLGGILLFSGSLYVLSLTSVRAAGIVTPLGGICFLAGWTVLAWAVCRATSS